MVAIVIALLSIRPALNLLSPNQRMNASFDRLRLVNTYGAFGSVTKVRREIVVEGTADGTEWREYEFRGKPTDPKRRPRQWAPFHLRLDWMMWFAALRPAAELDWFMPFIEKLLANERATLRMLATNPFPDGPPKAIRAVLYRYRFTTWRERRETGAWWERTRIREILPAISRSPDS